MSDVPHHPIIIIGGGPAGLATALHLAQRAPALANDLLIIEAAEHPRAKLCGGGVTYHAEQQLAQLGLAVDVPAFVVDQLHFRLGASRFRVAAPAAMRVIQRNEFDAALAAAVAARGVRLHANERLLDLSPNGERVTLETSRGRYTANAVVAADGAKSVVRRKLQLSDGSLGVARLLRVMTPLEPDETPLWRQRGALFDFSCVMAGIQGYIWDFPCYVNGRATMNRGIFDSRIAPERAGGQPHGHFKHTFQRDLQARAVDLDNIPLEGHPVRWFNPQGEFGRPRVLLVGDAAGVDPLFAEGISYALEYGAIAAEALVAAFARQRFDFADYRSRLLAHPLGRQLRRRLAIASSLYAFERPRLWHALWRCAALAPARIQRLFGAALGFLPV